jgi:hypothetical protein
MIYLKDPKDANKKILRSDNIFSKVAGCIIHIQKPVVFPYANKK